MEFSPVYFFVFVLFVIVLIGIFGFIQARKRREAFVLLAEKYGFRYIRRDPSIAETYGFLNDLHRGDNRYAYNILEGEHKGYPVRAFDFHYETDSSDSNGRRSTNHHHFSFFILEQEKVFPELRIYPENFLSKMGQMLGYHDIDFESAAFSRAFTIRSKDKRFAYDICNPQMIEYLMRNKKLSIEIEKRAVSLRFNYCLKPEQIIPQLDKLIEIRNLFPEYLYRD